MFKKFIYVFITVFVLTILCSALSVRAYTVETPKEYTFEVGIPGIVGQNEKLPITGLPGLILKLIFMLYVIGAIVAFVSLVVAGFKYMSSQGNDSKVKDAMDQIQKALIGLFILLGAYLILYTINPDLVSIPKNLFSTSQKFKDLNKAGDYNLPTGGVQTVESSYDYDNQDSYLVAKIKSNFGSRSDVVQWKDNLLFKDLDGQKLDPLILEVIEAATSRWQKPDYCGSIIVGPGVNGHAKDRETFGDYKSWGRAVDFEVPGIGEDQGGISINKSRCQDSLNSFLKAQFGDDIKTAFESTHLHVSATSCWEVCPDCSG